MVERTKLSTQIEAHSQRGVEKTPRLIYEPGNVISTGSTLLDLAISGRRYRYGGIPGGILVEIFGPSGCGKTVLLCEIAGGVQRAHGGVMFYDPEGRLNKRFGSMFGVDMDAVEYSMPNTVTEVFAPIREWKPKSGAKLNGIFADSLAALTTEMEMDGSDKYGMRRAKEFSEQLRLTCRTLAQNNYLMVCSNQIRQNLDAGPYGQKYKSPGGEAVGFYSSLRLRCIGSEKIKRKRKVAGKDLEKVIGVETEIEVFKSSVDEPYRKARISIVFDYGVDDIRANIQFAKKHKGGTVYSVGDTKLAVGLEESIQIVEEDGLQTKLRDETIGLWHEIDESFRESRQPKSRI